MIHDDPLDQLGRALSIAPSPEFAARVRQHISTQPARAHWWPLRHLAAAAAAVCVVSIVVMRWDGDSREDVRPVVVAAPVVQSGTVAPDPASATPVATAAARPRRSSPPVVPVESAFAETLVPDDQRLALERLINAIRAGRATVPAAVAEDIVDEDGRRMPRALVIEPLKLELLAGTPVGPNKDPIKESVK